MTDKEKIEKLQREAEESKKRLEEINKKDKGNPDVIHRDEVERMMDDQEKKIYACMEEQKKAAALDRLPREECLGSEPGETFGKFLHRVRTKDAALAEHQKVLNNEATDAQGGYLVPSGTHNVVIGEINNDAVITGKTTPFPHAMSDGFVKKIPKWLTGITGGWVSEQGVKTTSNPTFSQKTSTLNVYAVIVAETDELRADNIVNLDRLLAVKVGEDVALEMEGQILVGSGSPFTGIINDAGIKEIQQTEDTLDYSLLVDIQQNPNVLERYRPGSEWTMNRSTWAKIMKLVDGNQRPLWSLQPINNRITLNVLGDSVNLSSKILNTHGDTSDTSKIVYGNLKNVLTGFKAGDTGLTVDFSTTAIISTGTDVTTNFFTQNIVGWRFKIRRSVVIGNPEAFSVGDEIK